MSAPPAVPIALRRSCRRIRLGRLWRWGAAAVLLLAFAASAKAQTESEGDLQSWLAQPTMSGDWGGLRSELLDRGINAQVLYTQEIGRNTNGLHGVATDYSHTIAFGADV